MAWTCKLLDIVGTEMVHYDPPVNGVSGETHLVDSSGNKLRMRDLEIGSMFFLPKNIPVDDDVTKYEWPWFMAKKYKISDYYFENNAHRQPLFVLLPKNTLFLIDGKCWTDGRAYGGWNVSGEAPYITVSPSINISGTYHGWLQNGVLSDDCEGRVFT